MRALVMRHILLPLLLLFCNPLLAQELVEFENGQVADADDVNANFEALRQKIISLEERLSVLEPSRACLSLSQQGDGVSLSIQENALGITNALSISAWINVEGACRYDCGGQCELKCPILSAEHTNGGVGLDNAGYALLIYDGKLNAFIGTGQNITSKHSVSTSEIANGEWTHVAMTRSGNRLRLFINGELDSEFSVSGDDINYIASGFEHSVSQIGRAYPNGLGRLTEVFDGKLSDVTVWPRELSISEIVSVSKDEYDYLSSGAVGYWPLDDGEGSVATDLSGFKLDGSLEGGATWSDSCR